MVKSHAGNNIETVQCSQYSDSAQLGTTFTCTGNRAYYEDREKYNYLNNTDGQYRPYRGSPDTPTLIKNVDINKLRDYLETEIGRRSKHVWYRGLDTSGIGDDVQTGEKIIHEQQNNVKTVLGRLKTLIGIKGDFKTVYGAGITSRNVKNGDLVETTNLKTIERDLFNSGVDCICYSDCTEFKLARRIVCSCQSNYGCDCNYY